MIYYIYCTLTMDYISLLLRSSGIVILEVETPCSKGCDLEQETVLLLTLGNRNGTNLRALLASWVAFPPRFLYLLGGGQHLGIITSLGRSADGEGAESVRLRALDLGAGLEDCQSRVVHSPGESSYLGLSSGDVTHFCICKELRVLHHWTTSVLCYVTRGWDTAVEKAKSRASPPFGTQCSWLAKTFTSFNPAHQALKRIIIWLSEGHPVPPRPGESAGPARKSV